DDDVVARPLRLGDPLGDPLDALGIGDRGAAIFLHDKCHRLKLRSWSRRSKRPPDRYEATIVTPGATVSTPVSPRDASTLPLGPAEPECARTAVMRRRAGVSR